MKSKHREFTALQRVSHQTNLHLFSIVPWVVLFLHRSARVGHDHSMLYAEAFREEVWKEYM